MKFKDPRELENVSKRLEDENWEFRTYLKGCDLSVEEIDAVVHRLFRQVSSEVDCKTCANCCRVVMPLLDEGDAERLSGALEVTVSDFKNEYLARDDEEPGMYGLKEKPCPFLKENLCIHYEQRPKDCRSYPHLHKDGFVFRSMGVIGNCSVCPIVFRVYQGLKGELWDW